MSYIASSFTTTAARGQFSGQLYRIQEDFSSSKRIYLPIASAAIDRMPSGFNYGNRQYLVGGHSANLLIDEEFRGLRQGILPPSKPTVSSGAGGATPQIGYLRWYDEITGERSPLSTGTEFTGDLTRTWTSLPTEVSGEQVILEGLATIAAGAVSGVGAPAKTNFGELRPGDRIANAADLTRWGRVRSVTSQTAMTIDDTGMAAVGVSLVAKPVSRVSHVELWLAVFGSLPRFIMRVRVGTTSVTESTATLALGEAETVPFVAMPFGEFNLAYNDRQLIAGVEGHRDTVYLSAIGFPERYEGLKFVTAYNEPIVGMYRYSDYVVLVCPDSSYRLQGYTEDDYVRTVLEPNVGGLGHHGNAVTESYAIVPGRKGKQIFNGRFHPGIPTRRTEYSGDYLAEQKAWEQGFSVVNPNDQTYQFYPKYSLLTNPTLKPYVYVGHYDSIGSMAGGGLSTPEWFSDTHVVATSGTVVTTCAAYLVPSGTKIGKLYRGTNNGKIYEEDELGTVPFDGTSVAALAHLLGVPMDPGGGEGDGEGKELTRCWAYVRSEETEWFLRLWFGDEYAYYVYADSSDTPGVFKIPVAASESIEDVPGPDDYLKAPKTVHEAQPQRQARGWTAEFRFPDPLEVVLIGLGGVYGPGRPARNVLRIIPDEV